MAARTAQYHRHKETLVAATLAPSSAFVHALCTAKLSDSCRWMIRNRMMAMIGGIGTASPTRGWTAHSRVFTHAGHEVEGGSAHTRVGASSFHF
eukprot:12927810-Prorocentrum_lima.AAC.1